MTTNSENHAGTFTARIERKKPRTIYLTFEQNLALNEIEKVSGITAQEFVREATQKAIADKTEFLKVVTFAKLRQDNSIQAFDLWFDRWLIINRNVIYEAGRPKSAQYRQKPLEFAALF